jgi:predicted transcriptional regulator
MSTYDFNVNYIAEVMINRDEYEIEKIYEILEKIEGKKITPFKFSKKGCEIMNKFGSRFKVSVNDLEKFKKWFKALDFEKHEKWLDKVLEEPENERNIYKSQDNNIKNWGFDKYKISEILSATKKYLKNQFMDGWFADCDVYSVVFEDGASLGDTCPRCEILEILEEMTELGEE